MRKLSMWEMEMLIRWMLNYMPTDMRRRLMGDMPVIYKLLYPTVEQEMLNLRVEQRIQEVTGAPDVLPRRLNL